MTSDAVGLERISRVVGYKLTGGDFQEITSNLPQRVAILAEANEANQTDLSLTPLEVLSAEQAGKVYGFGSPIHQIMSILRPANGDGIGGIPTIVYPQAKAGSAVAKVLELTVTGTATKSGTMTLVVAGRSSVSGIPYDVNIVVGDTPTIIAGKIRDVINSVLGAPVIATAALGVVTLTSKWAGLTSQEINVTTDNNGDGLGVTYVVAQTTAGAGTPSVQPALDLFGSEWITLVINSYGFNTTVLNALEAFNGRPDDIAPTGRYSPIIFKPFVAVTGSVLDNPTTLTDGRLGEVTIALAPAPLSPGFHWEAAANMTLLQARTAQDNPHLDVAGQSYPDMPTPATIGTMAVYNNRDAYVKKGASTVDLVAKRYKVMDFVTTYHPVGENPPQFRYVRNLNVDFNVRYGYLVLEQINVVDHAIASNNDVVALANKVVKPKQWKQVLMKFAEDLQSRMLIVDTAFMQNSITVTIGTSNPDRLETFFKYKRSGFARVSSTTAQAGFNFGSIN